MGLISTDLRCAFIVSFRHWSNQEPANQNYWSIGIQRLEFGFIDTAFQTVRVVAPLQFSERRAIIYFGRTGKSRSGEENGRAPVKFSHTHYTR